ncbi:MAG TPA: AtzH-like domain-containing protein [Blastocatellia bacterium]|nr:AtzH-like domain-containing protein [Blastocatellia bacterium]
MKRMVWFSILVLFAIAAGITPARAQTSEKDPAVVEREVREVFDKWSTALGRGDKKTYLDSFWNSPRLVIRVANGEWRGIESYRKRIEAAQLPPASPSDYKNVEVVGVGRDAAVVTYERPAPGGATGAAGESLIFRGTAVFIRTAEGWKIASWHAHSVTEKSSAH